MRALLTQTFMTALLAGGIVAGVPLMFTALGESISERAGVLNIGLEGMMLLGAYAGFVGAYKGGSIWVGFLTGMAGGMADGLWADDRPRRPLDRRGGAAPPLHAGERPPG